MRLTSGYIVFLFGEVVSWMSKRQSTVILSTIEVEYVTLTHVAKEVIWLCKLCKELSFMRKLFKKS